MFWHRDSVGPVDVAFTDASIDLRFDGAVEARHASVARELGVVGLHSMSQVHGTAVVEADVLRADGSGTVPECDGLVTTVPGMALLVRVADCVPVLLADASQGVVGAAHAGRVGMVGGVVPATVERMRDLGATSIRAWVGPRACGRCYELPEEMVAEVDAAEPGTRSVTSWGTPAVDVGRGVVQQLERAGVEIDDVGARTCTLEDSRFFSYRRQGAAAGRFGGIVVLR